MADDGLAARAGKTPRMVRNRDMTQQYAATAEDAPSHANGVLAPTAPRALTTRQLEDRQIIHRAENLRREADAFRELRTRLCADSDGAPFLTLVVAVTSGGGASFVARNLAAAFAFDESKGAVLVDCNARHPNQGDALGLDSGKRGLKAYLDDEHTQISDVVHPSGLPGLDVVPWGTRREDAGDAFGSTRMRVLLDSLRAQYGRRYVIIDGPAISDGPDAAILSALVDRVVIVTAYGSETSEAVRAAIADFPPGKVAGVVFNQRP